MSSRVTIGLPTFNRPDYLRSAIKNLLSQSFNDFELIIANNASTDRRVIDVIEEIKKSDSRVTAIDRVQNIGINNNFKDVMERCTTPYFMWASDDDVWEPDFIATNLEQLERAPEAQMAFCTVDNINTDGTPIRWYDGFSRFTSGKSRKEDAARFVLEPEILGKANLFLGVFRTAALQDVCSKTWDDAFLSEWGADNVLLFAFLSRHPIVATDEVLLHKRHHTTSAKRKRLRHPKAHFVPERHFASYCERHMAVAPTSEIATLAKRLLWKRRMERAVFAPLSRLMPRVESSPPT